MFEHLLDLQNIDSKNFMVHAYITPLFLSIAHIS